jgi:glycerophosphoryl diester phosphodiesterase
MKITALTRSFGSVLVACAALAISAAPAQARPLVVAHRGGALLMPENTFPAFDNALRLGVDMLEFDMVMTADDQLVVTHDASVNPTFCTADGVAPGPVRNLTLAQVEKFDCGAKHRAIYPTQQAVPGTHMPTADAFFARYRKAKVMFFGEIKMPKPEEGTVDPVAFARMVDALVRKYDLEDRYILQSFDWKAIDAMHIINPRIRTCLLGVWREPVDHLDLARAHHANCMLLRLQDADAAEVKRLRAAGVQVFSDVVDDEAGWRAYLARGDDAIFTNDPAGLTTFLAAPRH